MFGFPRGRLEARLRARLDAISNREGYGYARKRGPLNGRCETEQKACNCEVVNYHAGYGL
jgi:hypothetical protein